MEDIHKYVGIPFEFAGHDFNGCDCIGLARLFYNEHHWKPELYDGSSFTEDWYERTPLRMVQFLSRHFNKIEHIEDLQFGDIMYFHLNGEGHCGIYVKYGRILTTWPNKVQLYDGSIMPSQSMIIHKDIWGQWFRAGFRRKGV